MSNTTNTTHVMAIQKVTSGMTLYGPIILLIIGTISCACNLLTFTSKKLRRNSCAFYFLCSSIFDFLSIVFGLLTRLAADHFGSRLQSTSRFYCKFRAYIVSAIPLIATYFVLLSAIDRCMSSSRHARLRSFSQIIVAYRAAVIVILLGVITCSHILVSYNLRPRCRTLPGNYAIFDGMFVVFWLGVIPHVLMWIFGSITLINIRRLQHRRMGEKTDRQLIIMMLVQVGSSSILILTRMIYYAYYLLGPTLTGEKKLIGGFLMSFTTLLYYANYAKSFYIYTLSSHLFRSIFLERIQEMKHKILHGKIQTLFSISLRRNRS